MMDQHKVQSEPYTAVLLPETVPYIWHLAFYSPNQLSLWPGGYPQISKTPALRENQEYDRLVLDESEKS